MLSNLYERHKKRCVLTLTNCFSGSSPGLNLKINAHQTNSKTLVTTAEESTDVFAVLKEIKEPAVAVAVPFHRRHSPCCLQVLTCVPARAPVPLDLWNVIRYPAAPIQKASWPHPAQCSRKGPDVLLFSPRMHLEVTGEHYRGKWEKCHQKWEGYSPRWVTPDACWAKEGGETEGDRT